MEYTLEDIVDLKIGRTPPRKESQWFNTTGDGYKWVSIKDMGACGRYISDTSEYLIEQAKDNFNIPIVERGTVLLSFKLTVGRVCIATDTMLTNEAIAQLPIRNKKLVDAKYLYYYLKGYNFNQLGSTSSIATAINSTYLRRMKIELPDIEQQKRVAAVLSSLDDRIEKNQQINNNLQQQAIALFQNTFPYGVEDDLPDGWRIASVGEIIELHDSRRIPLSGGERDKMENKIYPYYGATSLMDYVDNYIFDGIYLLLGEDGTVIDTKGYPVLQYVWGKFWVNNHAHILTGKLGFTVESLWVLFHLTSVRSIVTGAVQPKISQANLRSIRVVLPPQELLKSYNECIQPMFSTIRNNSSENERLSTLRDSLLPKLLNGEINVSEVEI